jgi:electron transfer flavoprotein beta subunit
MHPHMHIVVCIKQVPGSAQIRVHPVTNAIMRQGVPANHQPLRPVCAPKPDTK